MRIWGSKWRPKMPRTWKESFLRRIKSWKRRKEGRERKKGLWTSHLRHELSSCWNSSKNRLIKGWRRSVLWTGSIDTVCFRWWEWLWEARLFRTFRSRWRISNFMAQLTQKELVLLVKGLFYLHPIWELKSWKSFSIFLFAVQTMPIPRKCT